MVALSRFGTFSNLGVTHSDLHDVYANTKTLTFYGASCMQLQANPGVVSVGYTCPPPG